VKAEVGLKFFNPTFGFVLPYYPNLC